MGYYSWSTGAIFHQTFQDVGIQRASRLHRALREEMTEFISS